MFFSSLLGGSLCESDPSKQEKVAAAERATVGKENPVERFLDGVAYAYASKIDRSAIGAARREHLTIRFGGASSIGGEVMLERPPGGGDLRLVATAAIGADRFPGCFDLLRRPHVGLGKFNVFFRACDLALVPLR